MTSAVFLAVAIVFLSLLAFRSLADGNHLSNDNYSSSCRSSARLVFGFREICRTVLDPNVVTFLTENAPAEVAASFRVRQEQLTRFSLRVASDALFRRLIGKRDRHSESSFQGIIKRLVSRTEDSFLLFVCNIGRASLWFLKSLSYGIPRRVQLWVPAKVLSGIAGMVRHFASESNSEIELSDGDKDHLSENLAPDTGKGEGAVADDIRAAISMALPNDLSRMICLATLRDNNTGGYYHPELARRFSIEAADRAMLLCHRELYERLVSVTLEDLTDQLDVYFATAQAPKIRLIENWKKLRAYRATIPADADAISTEILFMKIEVALAILEARVPSKIQ